MTAIRNQDFGVESELTGITRRDAAKVTAEYCGTAAAFDGSRCDIYTAADSKDGKRKTGTISPTDDSITLSYKNPRISWLLQPNII